MALTDIGIRKAKTRGAAYRISDGSGLFVLVTPAGGKLWRWKYRFDGKEKLISFGEYPTVSLALARDKFQDARELLVNGIDPMEQRKADKLAKLALTEHSFQTIARQWQEHWKVGKSPRHADYVKRRMDTDILPSLGARPIAEIEAPELVGMVKAIAARGARDIAKRALETTGQVFRFAIAHGYARRNPAREIRPRSLTA